MKLDQVSGFSMGVGGGGREVDNNHLGILSKRRVSWSLRIGSEGTLRKFLGSF